MQVLSYPIVWAVRAYQRTLSPLLGSNCRFAPTCSHYMIDAVQTWGPFRGTWLGLRRIGRCHPWGGHGLDPVPPRNKPRELLPPDQARDS